MPDFTSLKGIQRIGDSQLSSQLISNMVEFFKWGMLGVGDFYNVYLSTQLSYGGNPSTLRLSDDRRYPKGMIWEGYKSNWVWEQEIEWQTQPIQISGIYVNNNFYPTGTNDPTYAYNISYPRGSVIFNNPIPTNSVVQCEYSHRKWGFYQSNSQWYHTLLDRLDRMDDYSFNWQGSGLWSIFNDARISFPVVVVEPIPNRKFVPKALGGGQWCYQDVKFHIYASDSDDRDDMVDILTYQNEKRFFFYDQNALAASSLYPLNINGYLVNPQSIYPTLVQNYLWTDALIWNVTAQPNDNESPNLYLGHAILNIEINLPQL
jgi:hypothetical protein